MLFRSFAYGGVVGAAGTWLHRIEIKKHFLEAYLHVAANVVFVALLSGFVRTHIDWVYVLGLLVIGGIAIAGGVRFRRFAFVVYGIVYGYIGISVQLMRGVNDATALLAYVAISGAVVIVSLVVLARRFGRET